MLKVVEKQDAREAGEEFLQLDEIAREGARRILSEALRAEADDYVERHRGERDEHGCAVVRNGRGQERKLTLGAGTVELKAPRGLAGRAYVYVWVDGVHFNIRLEDDRLCTLVMIGARPDGEKELLAVEDGYRGSAESWKTLLRDLKRRGMAAPVVAVGDGALGFWAAAREVWPATRAPGCWCHKLGNVLDKLPQRLQPRAKRALHEMMYAECRADCERRHARVQERAAQ